MRPNPDVVSGNVERIRRRLESYAGMKRSGDFSVVIKGGNYPGIVEDFSYTRSGMILGPENTAKGAPRSLSREIKYKGAFIFGPFEPEIDPTVLGIVGESFEEGSPREAISNLGATRRSYNREIREYLGWPAAKIA
jgi:hypothetical protein